jgi:glycosyltransferase involved in cell wall biosynthesis
VSLSFAIICPDYPPRRGGVADHTALLLAELAKHAQVTLITSEDTEVPRAPNRVQYVRDWQDEEELFRCVDRLPKEAVLLWAYVPHMYGRGGVAPAVPRVMTRLRTAGHHHQIVLAHEIAAPFSLWPHRTWYAWQHRQQWCRMVNSADLLVTSTEAWRDEWQARLPEHRAKFSSAASPSTIPIAPLTDVAGHRATWRRTMGWPEDVLVLGWFGTASAAKQLEWVLQARERAATALARPVALVLIGKADQVAQQQNSPWIKSTGYLEAAAVSHVLQSIDALLLPFIDGISERRTSFMAGLSHGTPVVTTQGHNTGPTLRAAQICRLASALDEEQFSREVIAALSDPAESRAMGERGRTVYRRDYDWPVVAEHFVSIAKTLK